MSNEPSTLQEAILHFSNAENCLAYMVVRRWPDGVVSCPTCGKTNPKYIPERKVWQCSIKHPKRQFSVKLGTIFEDSPIPLEKWLPAVWLLSNCKNGISSYEVARDLGVTQKTAWFMLSRIRLGLQDDLTGGMLGGEVEVDETFIGGKARNMHKADRIRRMQGRRGAADGTKTPVLGILERASEKKTKRVRATVIPDRKKDTMRAEIMGAVEKGSNVYSDEYAHVWRDDEQFNHGVVNHLSTYVDGQVHTNGMENFWSLLKRGLGGTYISVEPFHLFRYVDEQAFRFNNRKHADGEPMKDSERFDVAMRQVIGKRLTWAELTGKVTPTQEEAAF
jgi:transposase-like protein